MGGSEVDDRSDDTCGKVEKVRNGAGTEELEGVLKAVWMTPIQFRRRCMLFWSQDK